MKKLKKIVDNVFFFAAAGGLTVYIPTLQPGVVFWGIAWLSILFVVVVVVFLFLFSEMLPPPSLPPPSPYAVAARQIPTYRTYLTCRVADFTTYLGYLP